MNSASLKLCRELYDLSGWGGDDPRFNINEGWYKEGKPNQKSILLAPAYDLGYLLRKLPRSIQVDESVGYLVIGPSVAQWQVGYLMNGEYMERQFLFADKVPEDAACKLAIELFKQGILKRDA